MSDNKRKWYTVTTTRVVQANNKTEAIAARRRSTGDSRIVAETVEVDRISAVEGHQLVDQFS